MPRLLKIRKSNIFKGGEDKIIRPLKLSKLIKEEANPKAILEKLLN